MQPQPQETIQQQETTQKIESAQHNEHQRLINVLNEDSKVNTLLIDALNEEAKIAQAGKKIDLKGDPDYIALRKHQAEVSR